MFGIVDPVVVVRERIGGCSSVFGAVLAVVGMTGSIGLASGAVVVEVVAFPMSDRLALSASMAVTKLQLSLREWSNRGVALASGLGLTVWRVGRRRDGVASRGLGNDRGLSIQVSVVGFAKVLLSDDDLLLDVDTPETCVTSKNSIFTFTGEDCFTKSHIKRLASESGKFIEFEARPGERT